MEKVNGKIHGGWFYFEDQNFSHKKVPVAYGEGGKGNDWVGFELTPAQQIELNDGKATLTLVPHDSRGVEVDFKIENID